jgi:hypothetical protein
MRILAVMLMVVLGGCAVDEVPAADDVASNESAVTTAEGPNPTLLAACLRVCDEAAPADEYDACASSCDGAYGVPVANMDPAPDGPGGGDETIARCQHTRDVCENEALGWMTFCGFLSTYSAGECYNGWGSRLGRCRMDFNICLIRGIY